MADCCQSKGFRHCGECPDIPCALLTQYAYDKEHGDNGARIEQCKKWAIGYGMYRSAMQVFVKESGNALAFYQEAFDAETLCVYANQDGTLMPAELDVYGQVVMISELPEETVATGNTMMFCLHFGEGREATVRMIYEALKGGAKFVSPLASCDYSSLQADIVDKFGVRWCIFV